MTIEQHMTDSVELTRSQGQPTPSDIQIVVGKPRNLHRVVPRPSSFGSSPTAPGGFLPALCLA